MQRRDCRIQNLFRFDLWKVLVKKCSLNQRNTLGEYTRVTIVHRFNDGWRDLTLGSGLWWTGSGVFYGSIIDGRTRV